MKSLRILFCFTLVLCFSALVFAQQNKQLAENFSGATMDGQTVELESLKGKVVLITFWSTKCPICESEIPKLNKIAESYKGKEVVKRNVPSESAVEELIELIKQHGDWVSTDN